MSALEETLAQRGTRYGDFSDHAPVAQSLQDVMRGVSGWRRLDAVKRQSLTVIADKIARILTGDPEYDDNWHDIQGYARLVEERLNKSTSEKTALITSPTLDDLRVALHEARNSGDDA